MLDELFRFNCWANVQLLRFCAGLPREMLEAGSPGTYGTVIATLRHLGGAEERYLDFLEGTPRRDEVMEGANLEIAALLDEAEGRERRWLAYLAGAPDPEAVLTRTRADGSVVSAKVKTLLVQALHHGNDHRTHVCTVLGSHGIEAPALDGWTMYA